MAAVLRPLPDLVIHGPRCPILPLVTRRGLCCSATRRSNVGPWCCATPPGRRGATALTKCPWARGAARPALGRDAETRHELTVSGILAAGRSSTPGRVGTGPGDCPGWNLFQTTSLLREVIVGKLSRRSN